MVATVEASIVLATNISRDGQAMLVENAGCVGFSQTLTVNVPSLLRALIWKKGGYSIAYTGASGAFTIGETVSFDDGGTGIVLGGAASTPLLIGHFEGDPPQAADTVTGATSTETATVSTVTWDDDIYHGDIAAKVHEMAWRVEVATSEVYIATGSTPDPDSVVPTSATTARKRLPTGVWYFGVRNLNDKIAYTDV